MFIIHTHTDMILIPPKNLSLPTVQAIHNEIDETYPNRILMDVGLVICRYGDTLESIHPGVCVAGQGGAHYHCSFKLLVFRPFVEEVCIGLIHRSTQEGIYVTIGFFEDIFIPAYYMLRPSTYEQSTGLWVWTPDYGENDDDNHDDNRDDNNNHDQGPAGSKATENSNNNAIHVKQEEDGIIAGNHPDTTNNHGTDTVDHGDGDDDDDEEQNRYEMDIGAKVRFKIKSIHFARITNSSYKGRKSAIINTLDTLPWVRNKKNLSSSLLSSSSPNPEPAVSVRKRSSSVNLDEDTESPPTMYIVASICEDGLGCPSWWGENANGHDEQQPQPQEESFSFIKDEN